MTSLTQFKNNGIEIAIDLQTGEAFATQSGYARMSGLSQQAISKRCKGYNQKAQKNAKTLNPKGLEGYNQDSIFSAEVQTMGGIQGVVLISAELVFEWLWDDNPALAKQMGKAGATVYLHQLAGYKIESTATKKQPKQKPAPIVPTDEEYAYMQSRQWEKDELAVWECKSIEGEESAAIAPIESSSSILAKAGFDRAFEAAKEEEGPRDVFERARIVKEQKEIGQWKRDKRKGENNDRAVASLGHAIANLKSLLK